MEVKKDFLSIADFSRPILEGILSEGKRLKTERVETGRNDNLLEGKHATLLFEKPSLRTKLSFTRAMQQLGGDSDYFGPEEVQMGVREPASHVSRSTTRMTDVYVARVNHHEHLEELASRARIPVINALSDIEHPCQVLADIMTVQEEWGTLEGLNVAFVGDGNNNVTHSWCLAASLLDINFRVAAPERYVMRRSIIEKAKNLNPSFKFLETPDPREAVDGASVVVTDTWRSMGVKDVEERMKVFPPYQVNRYLMGLARKNAIFLHCMPAHLGEEVTQEIFDGEQSRIEQEAENRLHAQKGLLVHLLT